VLPVSDNVTGDDAGVVATGPPPPPGFGEPLCEFEPHAAMPTTRTNTNGAAAAAASNLLKRTFTVFSLSLRYCAHPLIFAIWVSDNVTTGSGSGWK
jgi:hypothetical protein